MNYCFRAVRRFGAKKFVYKPKVNKEGKEAAPVSNDINEILKRSVDDHLKKLGVDQSKLASPATEQPTGKVKDDSATTVQPKKKESLVARLKKLTGVDNPTFEQPKGQISGLYSDMVSKQLELSRQRSEKEIDIYSKGEAGIEVTPAASLFSVRYKRFINQIQRMEKKITLNREDVLNKVFVSSAERAKRIRDYRQIFVNYSLEEDILKLNAVVENYPGSKLGPLPEDDLDSFLGFISANAPRSMIKLMKLNQEEQETVLRRLEEGKSVNLDDYAEIDESDLPYIDTYDPPEAIPLENSTDADDNYTFEGEMLSYGKPSAFFETPLNIPEFSTEEAQIKYLETHYIPDDMEDIPSLPKFKFKSYQEMWPTIIDWVNFRTANDYNTIHAYVNDAMVLTATSLLTSPVKPEPVKIGSLYYYYKTLPKEFQEMQPIKDIYLGLEYSCPDKTLEEKEKALNFAVFKMLPMDPLSQDIIREHLSQVDKYQPNPDEVEKVYNMKPEFTWDIVEYMKEIKEERLRGESQVQEKQPQQFIKPPVYSFEHNGDANLPIDFYDNDDGFWDDYKQHKMQRYESVPLLKHRPYLKH